MDVNSKCDFTYSASQNKIHLMDEKEEIAERVRLLKELIDSCGSIVAFCKKYSRDDCEKSISPTFVSQLKNGSRSFGVKAARNMEEISTLPKYYFDPWRIDKDANKETEERFVLNALGKQSLNDFPMEEMMRVNEFLRLSEEKQKELLDAAKRRDLARKTSSGKEEKGK